MDQRLLETTLELDERHWWYRGRRQIIRAELDRLPLPDDARAEANWLRKGRTLPAGLSLSAVLQNNGG